MKKPTIAFLLLIAALLAACSQSTAPEPEPSQQVTLQVFVRSHTDNPWSWSAVAVVATPDSMYSVIKPAYDSTPLVFGALPRGARIAITSTLFSALPDSAWWISGRDTTRLYLAMGGSGDVARVYTVGARCP